MRIFPSFGLYWIPGAKKRLLIAPSNGLRPHYDPSNDSLNFLRNRLRNILIPTLETYNPKFREAIWRTVQSLNADYAILKETLNANWNKSLILQDEEYVMLDLSFLSSCSAGLQRHIIRRAVESIAPGQETAFSVLERASSFIADSSAFAWIWQAA